MEKVELSKSAGITTADIDAYQVTIENKNSWLCIAAGI